MKFKNKGLRNFIGIILFIIFVGLGFDSGLFMNNINTESTINEVASDKIEYVRDDWESSSANSFYDPIRDKKVGMKNYMLYVETKVDITSDEFSYTCPYTNEIITDYTLIEWDHIVPLYYAHEHGAANWSKEKKIEFNHDPENGVNVNRSDNREKSAKGPSEWLPDKNQEWYCQKWLEICEKWEIEIAPEDMEVINNVLNL